MKNYKSLLNKVPDNKWKEYKDFAQEYDSGHYKEKTNWESVLEDNEEPKPEVKENDNRSTNTEVNEDNASGQQLSDQEQVIIKLLVENYKHLSNAGKSALIQQIQETPAKKLSV